MNTKCRTIPQYIRDEAMTGRGYRNKRLQESSHIISTKMGDLPEYALKRRDKWTIKYRYDGQVTIEHDDDCDCVGYCGKRDCQSWRR